MTSWCFKWAMCGCAAILVGCATPLPTPVLLPNQSPAPEQGQAHGQTQRQMQGHVSAPPPSLVEPDAPSAPNAVDPLSADPFDQTPTPLGVGAPWMQRGMASWYGRGFNGRRTASGERFSASGLTAAHRTLPIHSYVRVRRVANGEEVIVRINDRGPFHSNRVLDLSHAAAQKLGIVGLGSAEVEIEQFFKQD